MALRINGRGFAIFICRLTDTLDSLLYSVVYNYRAYALGRCGGGGRILTTTTKMKREFDLLHDSNVFMPYEHGKFSSY